MTLPNNKVKFALTEVDYKPFISLFNVTNATATNPEISGIGENDCRLFFLLYTQYLQLITPLLLLSSYSRTPLAIMKLR